MLQTLWNRAKWLGKVQTKHQKDVVTGIEEDVGWWRPAARRKKTNAALQLPLHWKMMQQNIPTGWYSNTVSIQRHSAWGSDGRNFSVDVENHRNQHIEPSRGRWLDDGSKDSPMVSSALSWVFKNEHDTLLIS